MKFKIELIEQLFSQVQVDMQSNNSYSDKSNYWFYLIMYIDSITVVIANWEFVLHVPSFFTFVTLFYVTQFNSNGMIFSTYIFPYNDYGSGIIISPELFEVFLVVLLMFMSF